jgi:hypothetical protein
MLLDNILFKGNSMPKELLDKHSEQITTSAVLYDQVIQSYWYGDQAIETLKDIYDSGRVITNHFLTNWKTLLGDIKLDIKVQSKKEPD